MDSPVLTIGMATYDDFNGVCFTIQAIRMYHREALPDISFIVVDNNAQSPEGRMTKSFCEAIGVRYIDMSEPKGTSQTRNRVFEESEGIGTLCIDPHVFIEPGALRKLVEHYQLNPESKDLIQGPLLYDDLSNVSTHFADNWRGEMHGTWDTNPEIFKNKKGPAASAREWRWSAEKQKFVPQEMPYAYLNIGDQALEVPGQGLGLFTCVTKNWLGFNPHFRGFGGEEMYIHEKYRQVGAKCLVLPWLAWWHRFGRPAGAPYPLTAWNKVRNYVLGHTENGLDLDPVFQHFVRGLNSDGSAARQGVDGQSVGSVPQHEWDSLVEDPERPLPKNLMAANEKDLAEGQGCQKCGQDSPALDISEHFRRAAEIPSDMNYHATKLRELASQCNIVVDFSMRFEVSTVSLATGLSESKEDGPKKLITFAERQPSVLHSLRKSIADKVDIDFIPGNSMSVDIPECDLLFIDTKHTAQAFYSELNRHAAKVRRWIVRHDTDIFGEKGEDNGPGLMAGLRRFLKEHPEWSVIYHTKENYGLVVIGCDQRDKPKLPSKIKMAGNFAKALASHAASGAQDASEEELEKRLAMCSVCPHRVDDRCSICGCFLADKAKWKEQECPIGKWSEKLDSEISVEESTEELEGDEE